MHAKDCDENAEGEVEGNEKAVECTIGACKVGIEETGEGDSEGVHGCGRPKENPLPKIRG